MEILPKIHNSLPPYSQMKGRFALLCTISAVSHAFGLRMMMTTASAGAGTAGTLAEKKRAAMFGLFVGDAVAMPVHWMYNLHQLREDYGEIRGYTKPKDSFYGSIMNLSNTGK